MYIESRLEAEGGIRRSIKNQLCLALYLPDFFVSKIFKSKTSVLLSYLPDVNCIDFSLF